jgi:hypothetical protein
MSIHLYAFNYSTKLTVVPKVYLHLSLRCALKSFSCKNCTVPWSSCMCRRSCSYSARVTKESDSDDSDCSCNVGKTAAPSPLKRLRRHALFDSAVRNDNVSRFEVPLLPQKVSHSRSCPCRFKHKVPSESTLWQVIIGL